MITIYSSDSLSCSLYLTPLLCFSVCIQLHFSLSLSTSISLSLSFCLHSTPDLSISLSPSPTLSISLSLLSTISPSISLYTQFHFSPLMYIRFSLTVHALHPTPNISIPFSFSPCHCLSVPASSSPRSLSCCSSFSRCLSLFVSVDRLVSPRAAL